MAISYKSVVSLSPFLSFYIVYSSAVLLGCTLLVGWSVNMLSFDPNSYWLTNAFVTFMRRKAISLNLLPGLIQYFMGQKADLEST